MQRTLQAPEKVAAVAAAPEPPKFDPIALLQQDLKAFIYTHIPREYSSFLQCTLRRDKDGVQGGFFPTFYLQAERPGDGKKVSAQRTAASALESLRSSFSSPLGS